MRTLLSTLLACALLATEAAAQEAPVEGEAAATPPPSSPAPSSPSPPPPSPAAAAFDGDDARPTVLVLSLEPAGVSPTDAAVLDGMVANALSLHDEIQVVTAEELKQLMELEGQRQSIGCDTTSCLGEIAGAMGARYVIFGKAGRLGELFVVQLNVFDSTEAKAVGRREIQAGAIHELAPQVRPAVDGLVAEVTGVPVAQPAPTVSDAGGPSPLLLVGGGVAALGAVLAGGGGVMLGVWLAQLNDPDSTGGTKDVAAGGAPLAIGTVVVGSTAVVGGAGLAALAWGME